MQLKISKLIVAFLATCYLDNINFVKSQDNNNNLNNNDIKTRDEKLDSCIDGFVIHKNKIIRTKDSTDNGAEFLNEFNVDTKIECMKLCCLTEHCDVFIFEEKKPSSCYLFHCGPTYDFKCKFTNHLNYSSAVLTNYNLENSAALEEQIHITQQEHELKSLRKSNLRNHNNNYFQTDAPALKITSAPAIPSSTTVFQTPIKSTPACHRNQFECRSNGDCIAIYNVCDGIPQCPDGSDEAAELTCPVEKSTSAPTLHTLTSTTPQPIPQSMLSKSFLPSMPDILRYQQMMQQRNPYQFPYPVHNNNNNNNNQELEPNYGKIWPQNHHQFSPQENGYMSYPSPEEIANFGQFPLNYNQPPNYPWNNYPQIYDSKNINGLESLPPPNFPIGYDQDQPHIYKHKPMIHPNEPESSSNVQKPYGPNQKQGYPPFYPPNHHLEPWQEGNPNQVIHTSMQTPIYHQNDQKNDTSVPTTNSHENSKIVEDNSKSEDKPSISDKIEKSSKTATEKDKNKSESLKKVHQAQNPKAQKLEQHSSSNAYLQESKNLAVSEHIRNHSIKIEDLENLSPRGAIISLVIGLSITSVMIVLISCRLKVVKRRGRGRGVSHDADYLVNGMYL